MRFRSCHELLLSCALSFRYAYLKAASFILSDSKSPASGTSPRSRRIRGTTPRGVAVAAAAAAAPAFVILSMQTHEPRRAPSGVCERTPKAPGVIASTTALVGGLVRFQHTHKRHTSSRRARELQQAISKNTPGRTVPPGAPRENHQQPFSIFPKLGRKARQRQAH